MEVVKEVRRAFNSGLTRDLKWRKKQLLAIYQMLVDHEAEACEALAKDLHKPRGESLMAEINVVKMDVSCLVKNIDHWAKPEKVGKSFLTLTDSCYIQKQPYGVVLILGAWNYPIQLCLSPLAGAIVAGNCAILKPSEVSSETEKFLAKFIPQYLDKECFRVHCGGSEVATSLLKERFDLIFYTGNSNIAKIVMAAAAEHLTPVVLEMGGKSPAYIADGVDLTMVAHRLAWGKLVNAGQTCVAPDYVLCSQAVKDQLVEKLKEATIEFYGTKVSESPDYARIVNERHFDRLSKLLASTKGNVTRIGEDEADREKKFLPPTVVTDLDAEDALMKEEIFGPILPVVTVKDRDEAIALINEGEKPLALYVFTRDSSEMKNFEERTTSGAILHNDTVVHAAVDGLPFGGVGNSGMGCYHGRFSFEAFSHRRSCMNKATNETLNYMARYPPFNEKKVSVLNWAMGSNPKGGWCSVM